MVWALFGKGVNVLSALLVGILVARYLGPEKYGLMNYVVSYVSLFSVLATFGMDNIEIRELAREKVSKEVLLGTAFRLRLVFACLTMLLIAVTAWIFEADSFTLTMILVYSLSVVLLTFSVIRNYFTSIVLNEYVVKTEIFRTCIGAGVKIVLLLLHASLAWFIVALTFDFFLVASGYVYSYHAKVGQIRNWCFDAKVARYLVRQSFPLLLSGSALIVYQRIDQVMIRNMLDNTAVGYFATAGRFTELIVFLPLVMVQTISPLLVRVKEKNPADYEARKQKFVDVVVWTAILLSVGVSLCAYWLVRWSFGPAYLAAAPVLRILAFKTVGMALSVAAGQLIVIEHIQQWAVIRNLIGCAVCVVANYVLIPSFGIVGSAWATILTALFTGCLANAFIPPYHGIMKLQVKSLFFGWRHLVDLMRLIRGHYEKE